MNRGSVQLSQTGDETRYHFKATPRRPNNISDDSGSDDDEKKLPAHASAPPAFMRDNISDDSESEERHARDSVVSVSQSHKHTRQYSDFGEHRHQFKPHVNMLHPTPLTISDDEEEDESKDGLGTTPRRLQYAIPERDESVASSAALSDGSETPSLPQPHVIFGGRRSAAGSGASSGTVSPRSHASSSQSQRFPASPRGRGRARVSAVAAIRGRTLQRGASSPQSASRGIGGGAAGGGMSARRGGRLRPVASAGRGSSSSTSSAAARTTAAAVSIYGHSARGRGGSGTSRRGRGGRGRGGGGQAAGGQSQGGSRLASPRADVHVLQQQAAPPAFRLGQERAAVQPPRPVSPDSDEIDMMDDDSWQR